MSDPIVMRTLFYERGNRDNKETFRFLPWCMVTVAGAASGKMFEPADCLGKRISPSGATGGIKLIHKIEEFNGKAKLFQCESCPDQTLHSFGSWDWPLE